MGKIIELTHDDVQNELAYALICETMEGAYWNSGRRRRMFSKAFTRSEQQRISNIKAKAHKWYLVTGVPEKVRICSLIDVNVKNGGKEMQAAMFQLPTPEIPAPFCRLYDEQGSDEEDWFAAASFSPRSDNDGSKHPVFVDDGFGKPVPASDVIQNRDGEFSSRCSTSKELFDFNVEVAQNR